MHMLHTTWCSLHICMGHLCYDYRMNMSQMSSGLVLLGYLSPTTDWHPLILLFPNPSKCYMVKKICPYPILLLDGQKEQSATIWTT